MSYSIGVDNKFSNNWKEELSGGTVVELADNVFTFTADVSGTIRRTKWVHVQEGQTVYCSVEMSGDTRVNAIIFSAVDKGTEVKQIEVGADSPGLKKKGLRFTVPMGSGIKIIGFAMLAENNAVANFYNPQISIESGTVRTLDVVGCGTVDFAASPALVPGFPAFGVTPLASGANIVRIFLDGDYISKSDTQGFPLIQATESTSAANVNGFKLVASDVFINATNGQTQFDLYFVNSSGVIQARPAGALVSFEAKI